MGRSEPEPGVELGRGVDTVGGMGRQTEQRVGGGPALPTMGVVVVGAGGGVLLVGLLKRLAGQVTADKGIVGREDAVVLGVGAFATVTLHLNYTYTNIFFTNSTITIQQLKIEFFLKNDIVLETIRCI